MDGGGQKLAWSFRYWDSKICCVSRMTWGNQWNFFHADTNLGKLKFTSIIIGWACSKMGEAF